LLLQTLTIFSTVGVGFPGTPMMNMRADARSSMQPFDSVCCLAQRIFLGSCHFLGRLGSASFDFVGQLQRPSFPWVLRVHGQRYRTLPHAAPFFITDAPTGRKCAPAPKRTLLRKNTLHDDVSYCAEVGREREKRVWLRNITFGSPFALMETHEMEQPSSSLALHGCKGIISTGYA
jgi:hypothetical protein